MDVSDPEVNSLAKKMSEVNGIIRRNARNALLVQCIAMVVLGLVIYFFKLAPAPNATARQTETEVPRATPKK